MTNGIYHRPTKKQKVTVKYAYGTPVTTNKCTSKWVDLERGANYFWMHYPRLLTTELTAKRQEKIRAEPQEWDVPSVRSLSAKSA
jgi:hypothetical protein